MDEISIFHTNAFWYGLFMGGCALLGSILLYSDKKFFLSILFGSLGFFGLYVWFGQHTLVTLGYLGIGVIWYAYNIQHYKTFMHAMAALYLWPFDVILKFVSGDK